MESGEKGRESLDNKNALSNFKQGKKKEIIKVLTDNDEIVSVNLDFNQFQEIGKRENGVFNLNPNLLHQDENNGKYIVIDDIKYYENSKYGYGYKQIEDAYGIPYFYIGEVSELGIPNGNGIALRCDGAIFSGEWNKKGTLRDENRRYTGAFHEGKPIDVDTRPSFQRKGEYEGDDGTIQTYIAYPMSLGMIRFIHAKDNKKNEDWSEKRGSVVSIDIQRPTCEVEHKLHSWNRELSYSEDENNFIFSTNSGFQILLPKYFEKDAIDGYGKTRALMRGADRARYLAHLVNAIGEFISHCPRSVISSSGDDIKIRYKGKFFKNTLIKDIPDKIEISAKEFAKWLNEYYGK